MAREDELWAAPSTSPPAQPLMGHPPYASSSVTPPQFEAAELRAVRMAWFERRFPDAGSWDAREARQTRLGKAGLWLLSTAVVAFVVWLVVNDVPEAPDRTASWASTLFVVVYVVWVATAVPLAFLTRGRPFVAAADVDILRRLTGSERRALVADMRAAVPPDPDDLDVVAAAWLNSRKEVLLLHPVQVLVGVKLLSYAGSTPWVVLPAVAVAWPLWGIVDGVPRLLAARAWLRRRAVHDAVRTG